LLQFGLHDQFDRANYYLNHRFLLKTCILNMTKRTGNQRAINDQQPSGWDKEKRKKKNEEEDKLLADSLKKYFSVIQQPAAVVEGSCFWHLVRV